MKHALILWKEIRQNIMMTTFNLLSNFARLKDPAMFGLRFIGGFCLFNGRFIVFQIVYLSTVVQILNAITLRVRERKKTILLIEIEY